MPVAHAVAFLLSDWARGITGEILHVDGGYHAMGADLGRDEPGDPAGDDGAASGGDWSQATRTGQSISKPAVLPRARSTPHRFATCSTRYSPQPDSW